MKRNYTAFWKNGKRYIYGTKIGALFGDIRWGKIGVIERDHKRVEWSFTPAWNAIAFSEHAIRVIDVEMDKLKRCKEN